MVWLIVLFWNWLVDTILYLFGRQRGQDAPAPLSPPPIDVTAVEALPSPLTDRAVYPAIFAFPVPPIRESDARLWEALSLAVPKTYRVLDPEFERVLAMQTMIRTLRLVAPFEEDEEVEITVRSDAWRPPYQRPTVSPWYDPAKGTLTAEEPSLLTDGLSHEWPGKSDPSSVIVRKTPDE